MSRDPYRYFRLEARELTDQLGSAALELERDGSAEVVARLLRLAHTLKGAARVVRLGDIAEAAHEIEGLLAPARGGVGGVSNETIGELLQRLDQISTALAAIAPAQQQVEAETNVPSLAVAEAADVDALLDGLSDMGFELRALDTVARMLQPPGAAASDLDRIAKAQRDTGRAHDRLERDLAHLHEAAERLRLVPAQGLLTAAARAARDSARALGKAIEFVGEGGEIRLDAAVVRVIQDAMLQLARNAVAHGIEAPAARLAGGKPGAGRVTVSVRRSGRRIVFRCEDDGKGIDVAALREVAIRNGRSPSEVDGLLASGLVGFLMHGGASTAPNVSEVAGRGIGMDMVRDAVTRLGARIDVTTEPGISTRFEIVAPLTMSSLEVLRLQSGDLDVCVPLHAVREIARVTPSDVHRSARGDVIVRDEQSIRVAPLAPLIGRPDDLRPTTARSVAIIEAASGTIVLTVSRVRGTAGILLRGLPTLALASPIIAGACVDAGGRAMLVLDPEQLVAAALEMSGQAAAVRPTKHHLLVVDDSITTRMLEQSILESAGFDVDVAVSAEHGLARVRATDYALVLVDVEMPGMDGFGFIEELRRDARLRDLPAILVTSRNAPEDRQRGHDVGAQDYVVKSEFDQAKLISRIRELVAR